MKYAQKIWWKRGICVYMDSCPLLRRIHACATVQRHTQKVFFMIWCESRSQFTQPSVLYVFVCVAVRDPWGQCLPIQWTRLWWGCRRSNELEVTGIGRWRKLYKCEFRYHSQRVACEAWTSKDITFFRARPVALKMETAGRGSPCIFPYSKWELDGSTPFRGKQGFYG